jgi:hypothetical protein
VKKTKNTKNTKKTNNTRRKTISPKQQKIADLVGRGVNTVKDIAYLGRGFTQIYTDLISSALISVNLCQQLILVGY